MYFRYNWKFWLHGKLSAKHIRASNECVENLHVTEHFKMWEEYFKLFCVMTTKWN